jgi:hypothetical protein
MSGSRLRDSGVGTDDDHIALADLGVLGGREEAVGQRREIPELRLDVVDPRLQLADLLRLLFDAENLEPAPG